MTHKLLECLFPKFRLLFFIKSVVEMVIGEPIQLFSLVLLLSLAHWVFKSVVEIVFRLASCSMPV